MNSVISKSMLLQELNTWLEIVVQWQQKPLSIVLLLDQSSQCEELVRFLENLKTVLMEIASVDYAVQEFPQVGQLLGRLTTVTGVMCHPRTYQALMACIFFFYVPHPATPIQTRAQNWVVSQVRNTVCSSESSESNLLLQSTGVTQQQLQIECVKKVIDNAFTEHSSIDYLVNTSSPIDRQSSLKDVCLLCLHLSESPTMNMLLEKLVCNIGQYSPREAADIYQILSDSQKHAYTEEGSSAALSFRTTTALWTNYLPALEQEVLLLVDACCHLQDTFSTEVQELLQSRHLSEACALYVSVYETVFSILRFLYFDTYCSTCIGHIITALHRSVRDRVTSYQSKMSYSLRCMVPQWIRPFMSIIETTPVDLNQTVCERNLQELSKQLDVLARTPQLEGGGDWAVEHQGLPHLVLLQYREWSNVALLMALLGNKQVCAACCHITLVFHTAGPVPNTDKEHLGEVVQALRPLMMKSHLQWDDIQCALSTNPYTTVTDSTQQLLGQLVLLFVTHSVSGNRLVADVLEKILKCDRAVSKFSKFLNCLESVCEFWGGSLRLTPLSASELKEILDVMERDAVESSAQVLQQADINQEQSEKPISRNISKCASRIKKSLTLLCL